MSLPVPTGQIRKLTWYPNKKYGTLGQVRKLTCQKKIFSFDRLGIPSTTQGCKNPHFLFFEEIHQKIKNVDFAVLLFVV